MIKHAIYVALASCLAAASLFSDAFADENIVRPYFSVRSAGMGGTSIMTGLYEENFFGNPARVTQNPEWRAGILGFSVESTLTTLQTAGDLLTSDNYMVGIGSKAGKNSHARIQMVLPGAIYIPRLAGNRFSLAFGILMSTQTDLRLRRSFNVDPLALTDAGPALTFGAKFLREDALSVGVTTHLTYRLSTLGGYSFVDLIQGDSFIPTESGGEGTHVDFDLGATYRLPWKPNNVELSVGIALNQLLGGKYNNIPLAPLPITQSPLAQPRTVGFGFSARRATTGKFRDTLVALEFTDIGNNSGGSLFRLIHLGAETHFSVLVPRVGINQGYLAAGLGLDLKFFELDLATHGEEMSLNAGGLEDRRFAVSMSFHL